MAKTNIEGLESRFIIPGIYNDLYVVILPRKFMVKKYALKIERDELLNAFYDHDLATIYLAKELSINLREQAFFHELIHYLEYITKDTDEEMRCDLVGNYMSRLYKDSSFRNSIKNVLKNKRLK